MPYVEVREDYVSWWQYLAQLAERVNAEFPKEWAGWEPTNAQMQLIEFVRESYKEDKPTGYAFKLSEERRGTLSGPAVQQLPAGDETSETVRAYARAGGFSAATRGEILGQTPEEILFAKALHQLGRVLTIEDFQKHDIAGDIILLAQRMDLPLPYIGTLMCGLAVGGLSWSNVQKLTGLRQ